MSKKQTAHAGAEVPKTGVTEKFLVIIERFLDFHRYHTATRMCKIRSYGSGRPKT